MVVGNPYARRQIVSGDLSELNRAFDNVGDAFANVQGQINSLVYKASNLTVQIGALISAHRTVSIGGLSDNVEHVWFSDTAQGAPGTAPSTAVITYGKPIFVDTPGVLFRVQPINGKIVVFVGNSSVTYLNIRSESIELDF